MCENLQIWLSRFATSDYFIGAASLLLLLFLVRIFFKKHWISVSSSKFGKVRMSRRALYSVVYGIANSIDGISGQRVKLIIKRGKIHINISVKLSICRNISEMTGEVQTRLSDVLINDLGLGNIGRINIVVAKFSRKSCCGSKFMSENCCEHSERKVEDVADEDA